MDGISRVFFSVAAVVLSAAGVASQTPDVIPDGASCSTCRIDVRPVLQLTEGIPSSPQGVARDSKGRYWLTYANEPAIVFDGNGRFIRELKRGNGPGEFQFPWAISTVGDSVLVQDRGRGFVVLGPTLEFVRNIPPVPLMGHVIPFAWPDSVLVNTRRVDQPANQNPYHVVSLGKSSTKFVRSFGADPGQASTDAYANTAKIMVPTKDGFWAADFRRYAVTRWSLSGTPLRAFVRNPKWFSQPSARMNLREPPPSYIAGVSEDERGLLWIFINVPASTWREGMPRLGQGVGEVRPEAFAYEKLYRTTIEVIDPAAKRVVVRQELSNYVVSPLPGNRAAIYDTTEDGEPFVRIISLILRR